MPDLSDRLRGIYRIPIIDGLGAVGAGEEPDNPTEFVRHFPTTPIQKEAADRLDLYSNMLDLVANFIIQADPNYIELSHDKVSEEYLSLKLAIRKLRNELYPKAFGVADLRDDF